MNPTANVLDRWRTDGAYYRLVIYGGNDRVVVEERWTTNQDWTVVAGGKIP